MTSGAASRRPPSLKKLALMYQTRLIILKVKGAIVEIDG